MAVRGRVRDRPAIGGDRLNGKQIHSAPAGGVFGPGAVLTLIVRLCVMVVLVALAPLVCAVGVSIRGILRTVRSHR